MVQKGNVFSMLSFDHEKKGLSRDLNPGPLAPKARIIPLDQRVFVICSCTFFSSVISLFWIRVGSVGVDITLQYRLIIFLFVILF